MISTQRISRAAVVAVFGLLAVAGSAFAKPPSVEAQLDFGVKMAKRGLWSEALFRFRAAAESKPGDAKILNNLAVAYEAVGRFDDALDAYQKAIRANPGNRNLKRNYQQFLEFYQGFRPREEAADGADDGADQADESEPTAAPEPDDTEGRRPR